MGKIISLNPTMKEMKDRIPAFSLSLQMSMYRLPEIILLMLKWPAGPLCNTYTCPLIVHGYHHGGGIVILNGGAPGDLIHGIGMQVFITTISTFILAITIEPMYTGIPVGITGIMETMAGDPDR